MPSNTCRICKKPLTDFTSVRLGIGPVCRARDGLNLELDGLIPHADFSIVDVTSGFICIKDTGGNSRSITDDPEYVLQKLAAEYGLKKRRVFYTDTLGQIDELAHNSEGHFTGFKPGHKGVAL